MSKQIDRMHSTSCPTGTCWVLGSDSMGALALDLAGSVMGPINWQNRVGRELCNVF